jgi:hypothetical protein
LGENIKKGTNRSNLSSIYKNLFGQQKSRLSSPGKCLEAKWHRSAMINGPKKLRNIEHFESVLKWARKGWKCSSNWNGQNNRNYMVNLFVRTMIIYKVIFDKPFLKEETYLI